MADDHGQSPPLPTAIHLTEPSFPSPSELIPRPVLQHGLGTALKLPATPRLHPPPSHLPEKMDSPHRVESGPTRAHSVADTVWEEERARPSIQKSATEQPASRAQSQWSALRRAGTAQNTPRHDRPAYLTFNPYLSDSDSSSSDDDGWYAKRNQRAQRNGAKGCKMKESSLHPFSRFKLGNDQFHTKGKVSRQDGRLKLSISETLNSGYFAKTFAAGLRKHLLGSDDADTKHPPYVDTSHQKIPEEEDYMEDPKQRMRLNIVIIVIGSRGDIQPFLRIGKILKEDYGHRVRIATHPAFKQFVERDSGLEFFSIGGDPAELMAFMVKNPGLIPNLETVKDGEIGRRRAAMYDMFEGMWRACVNATDDETDHANLKMMADKIPFVCDAIIANPPSFAPPHIAERLGVPLHMMFTFPYTPTSQFPHPLANIKTSNVDAKYTNFMSYPLVEMMTWQGLGDLINRFRAKTLHLDEVSTLWAPGQLFRLKVPYTYMWSPSLVPKPKDWGPEIDIAGFVYLDLASSFKPPPDLAKFLDEGEPPVYIGFGSIVVDDPDQFTKLIFKAVELAGVRALVSKGWGGFGNNATAPDNIYMLENTPHDWLFPKVSAVVHHGGAGTTAIGLKCGRPTMIIPFFGDQPFWGSMVAKARAGAHECIPFKKLTAEKLAEGIKQCLTQEAKRNVQKIAESIAREGDGALNAVRSFHRSLPLHGENSMRCSLLPNRVAAWRLKNTSIKLSPLAAELLVEWKKVKWNELRLMRQYEWNDFGGPGEPITGIWGALIDTFSEVATGVGRVPMNMAKSVKKREQHYEKKYRIYKRQKQKQRKKQEKKTVVDRANRQLAQESTNEAAPIDSSTNTRNNIQSDGPEALSRLESSMSTVSELDDLLAVEFAKEAKLGLRKTGGALLRAPMRMHLAIAQGFHNAPRLYGDETVRRPPRVTGFHSGVRAGRDELVYGVCDGISGLWMQPYRGARTGGVLGLLEGFGMGIGGFILKDLAALIGPGAYFMKGVEEEYMKKYQPTHLLRRARIIQGRREVAELESRVSVEKPRTQPRGRDPDWRSNEARKWAVEKEVSKNWHLLQPKIKEERRRNRSGLKAALLGQSSHKEGAPMPLKSRPATPVTNGAKTPKPKKAATAPISQGTGTKSKQQTNGVNGESGGIIPRSDTAPVTAEHWKEKGAKKKYRFEAPLWFQKEEAKKHAVTGHVASNGIQNNRATNVGIQAR